MSSGVISYTGRDIQDIRDNLVKLVQKLDNNSWTDFNESDIGMAFIEIAAGLGDMLGFYLDKQALETYIDSVKQRRNGIAILGLVGYSPAMTNSCVTTATVKIAAQEKDIYIPRYTRLSGSYNKTTIFYYTKEDAIISAGDTIIKIPVIEGVLNRANSTVGTLKTSQKIYINSSDVARGTMKIVVGEDDEWTQIDNVLYDDTASKTYSVFEDKDCKPYVLFNNAWLALLPEDDSTSVHFTYLTSLGTYGKISKNVLSSIDSENVFYADGTKIDSSIIEYVTNDDLSSGGSERETLDHARTYAPYTFRMLGKAIVLNDFYFMTMTIPGVLKCRAVDWSVDDSYYVEDPYRVLIYIVPTDGGNCSEEFLQEITNYYMNENDHRCLSSVQVEVMTAQYLVVNISATIYTTASSNDTNDLRSEIMTAIEEYFKPENLSFGQGVAQSNLIALIQDSSSKVVRLTLESPEVDYELNKVQFPQLGTVDLKFISVINTSDSAEEDDDL